MNKTVAQYYGITQDDIDGLAQKAAEECGNYWVSCEKFVLEVLYKSVDSLSEAQRLWIQDILNVIQMPRY